MRLTKIFLSGAAKKYIQVENCKNKGRVCRIQVGYFFPVKVDCFHLTAEDLVFFTRRKNIYDILRYVGRAFDFDKNIILSLGTVGFIASQQQFACYENSRLKFQIRFPSIKLLKWLFQAFEKIAEARKLFLLSSEMKRRNFGRRTRFSEKPYSSCCPKQRSNVFCQGGLRMVGCERPDEDGLLSR